MNPYVEYVIRCHDGKRWHNLNITFQHPRAAINYARKLSRSRKHYQIKVCARIADRFQTVKFIKI